jgi:hypothetical protein
MTERNIDRIIPSVAATEGAGVRIRRSLGARQDLRLDPFLLLDEFYSDDPADYLAGFPSHPHRGFETVTYMLDGHMRHEDHLGNRGDLGPGDVQWMTAARGIIHSEMPQQTEGRMRGFQLWLNLPAAEKMKPASYRDISSSEIPTANIAGGGSVRIIAGVLGQEEKEIAGPIRGLSTEPFYFDVSLPQGGTFAAPIPDTHSVFAYLYEGSALVEGSTIPSRSAAVFAPGELVRITAGEDGARFLLVAGKPLGEPVVQYGPFVMNTREQIEQAMADYHNGRLTA